MLSPLRAELIKIRRGPLLMLFIICPLFCCICAYFPASYDHNDTRKTFIRVTWHVWTVIIAPLVSAVVFSYLVQMEKQDNKWDYWRALPIPSWQFYLTKLVIAVLWFFLTSPFLAICACISMHILGIASLSTDIDMFRLALTSAFGSIWLLSVYWLIALRFENAALLLGVAIFGSFATALLQAVDAEWIWVLPWSRPLMERDSLAICVRNIWGTASVLIIGLVAFSAKPVGRNY